ncbi:UNVERIFIED_CONTAM: hypothetical protein HDU68_000678 [Siphonaria sp. JEL0065]|nr:hypothetical protein HDU68_000678 [Siphonaria sp. JEL0065]
MPLMDERCQSPITDTETSVFSLPFEIVQELLKFLPINRTELMNAALASKQLFATSLLNDLCFVRNHVEFQFAVSQEGDLWSWLDKFGIKDTEWTLFPLCYQAAIYGEILKADDWSGIRGWSGSDMTNNKMWYKRWKLNPTRALSVMTLLLQDRHRFNPAVQKNRALRWAARSGHMQAFRKLLEDGRCDPTDDDNYAIQCAAESGEIEIVELLLNIPASPTRAVDPSANDGYAIKLASRHGHANVVERLMEDSRIDPTVNFNEAIRNACGNGHANVVELLLRDEDVDPGIIGNLALKDATRLGHTEVVRVLLKDARVDPTQGPRSPLFFACGSGHLEIVKLLLADKRICPQDRHNEALWKAAECGHDEIVKLLMEDARVREEGWCSTIFQGYITTHVVDPTAFSRIMATLRRINGNTLVDAELMQDIGRQDFEGVDALLRNLDVDSDNDSSDEDELDDGSDADFDEFMDENGWEDESDEEN